MKNKPSSVWQPPARKDRIEIIHALHPFLAPSTSAGSLDVILVCGSNDSAPPRKAAERYHLFVKQNPNLRIMASGNGLHGHGHATVPAPLFTIPECEAFRDIMVGCGVPPEKILLEHESRHTGGNLLLSAAILREQKIKAASIALIHTCFFQRRANQVFLLQWPLPWISLSSCPPPLPELDPLPDDELTFHYLCAVRELATLAKYMHQPEPYAAKMDIPEHLIELVLPHFQSLEIPDKKFPIVGNPPLQRLLALADAIRAEFSRCEAERLGL